MRKRNLQEWFRQRAGGSRPLIVACLVLLFPWSPSPLNASSSLAKAHELDRLVQHGGFLVRRGKSIVAARAPDTLFMPASTWKIATALEAIKILGSQHRFKTLFYQNEQGDLFIQGQGDPFLISEEIAVIVERLKAKGLRPVGNIILDDSFFSLATPPDGAGSSLNPYDVLNSGLAVNFNTVNIRVDSDGSVQSAEPQTPFLPIMAGLAKGLTPGEHRVNITQNPAHIWQYTGELFQAFLNRQDVPVRGGIRRGVVPQGLAPLYRHDSSKGLTAVLEGLLLYSNNFIANQVFLACGVRRFGSPATWDKGKMALEAFLKNDVRLPESAFRVEEGSGLSRKNRITPRAMLTVLEAFKPYARILPLEKKRRIKSGTLSGVYSYVGYFQRHAGLDAFVLLLNQEKNTRDRVVDILEKF